MLGKLCEKYTLRITDDVYQRIVKMPWEKRKAMNEKIRKLIEKESQISPPAP